MSSFPAAVLLLLLSTGLCAAHWRRWDNDVYRRPPWLRDMGKLCRRLTKCPGCTGVYTDSRGCDRCRHCPWRSRLQACPMDYSNRYCGFTPAADITCTGGTRPVPCGAHHADRRCPTPGGPGPFGRRNRTEPCTPAEKRLGARCGCEPRRILNERGACVPHKECGRCDRATEFFSLCRAHCQPSCGRPHWPRPCSRNCRAGCVCKRAMGYIRDEASGKCVKRDTCPVRAVKNICRRLTKCPDCRGVYIDKRGCTRCRYCPSRPYICLARSCGFTPADVVVRVTTRAPTIPSTVTATTKPCAWRPCPPCHKCTVNVVGQPKCVHKGTCYDEFPNTGCPPGQRRSCHTAVPLCHWANCASGYSCIDNYCLCKANYYDPRLNQVAICSP